MDRQADLVGEGEEQGEAGELAVASEALSCYDKPSEVLMMITPQKIYRETVREMSREERLQLAALILNGLAGSVASSVSAAAEDEIGRLYDEIARLSEMAGSEPVVQEQLRAAWRRLRELQSQEARAFRSAFEASLAVPTDAGKQILAEARALRRQLEDLTSADPTA